MNFRQHKENILRTQSYGMSMKNLEGLFSPPFIPHPSYFILLVARALGGEIEIKLSA